jgi:hypothetical protein
MGCIIKRKWKPLNRFKKKEFKYTIYPAAGDFFEYRLTKAEYLYEVKQVGFEVLEHLPLSEIDGIYHELNPLKLLVKFRNWKFKVSHVGYVLNDFLSKWPFLHCHMQVVVARKQIIGKRD